MLPILLLTSLASSAPAATIATPKGVTVEVRTTWQARRLIGHVVSGNRDGYVVRLTAVGCKPSGDVRLKVYLNKDDANSETPDSDPCCCGVVTLSAGQPEDRVFHLTGVIEREAKAGRFKANSKLRVTAVAVPGVGAGAEGKVEIGGWKLEILGGGR
jgi:hypothetical protein